MSPSALLRVSHRMRGPGPESSTATSTGLRTACDHLGDKRELWGKNSSLKRSIYDKWNITNSPASLSVILHLTRNETTLAAFFPKFFNTWPLTGIFQIRFQPQPPNSNVNPCELIFTKAVYTAQRILQIFQLCSYFITFHPFSAGQLLVFVAQIV